MLARDGQLGGLLHSGWLTLVELVVAVWIFHNLNGFNLKLQRMCAHLPFELNQRSGIGESRPLKLIAIEKNACQEGPTVHLAVSAGECRQACQSAQCAIRSHKPQTLL